MLLKRWSTVRLSFLESLRPLLELFKDSKNGWKWYCRTYSAQAQLCIRYNKE